MTAQIFWGSLLLGICALIHLVMIVIWVSLLNRVGDRIGKFPPFTRHMVAIGGTFALLVLSHTIQVWIWAGFLIWLGALSVWSESVYFSMVTYTTVGYGDVTLSNDFKLFGAMASVTGLLNFGVSTAFLVGVIGKLLPRHIGNHTTD